MPRDNPLRGDMLYSAFFPDTKNPGNIVVEGSLVLEVTKYDKPKALIPKQPEVEDKVWLKTDKGMVPWKEASFSEQEALTAIIAFLQGTSAMADADVEKKRRELAETIQQVEEYKEKSSLRIAAAKAKIANTCSQKDT